MATIIQLDQVGVCYRRGSQPTRSLKELATWWIKHPLTRIQTAKQPFWALRDIDLQVQPGMCLGVIGANGAGKSTLLKVIARVLVPTTGRVRLWGQVAPLLELGAGFDGELTGRENIFLNGALLGYAQTDLQRRFDNIVDFAGIAAAIDSPVRTYSSGMIARLGFAIATDQQPAVLIIDEVLGVGDGDFQRRSTERILAYHNSGTTILVVSHSLTVIEQLCPQAIWLQQGQLREQGAALDVLRSYRLYQHQQALANSATQIDLNAANRWGSGRVRINRVQLCDANRHPQVVFATGEPLLCIIDFEAHEPITGANFGVAVYSGTGTHLSGPNTQHANQKIPVLSGKGQLLFHIPALPLLDGTYFISVAVVNELDTETFDYHDRAYSFQVFNQTPTAERYGLLALQGEWTLVT